MILLLRNISHEVLDKIHLTTDILVKFEDKGIKKEFYNFINSHYLKKKVFFLKFYILPSISN